MKLTLRVPVSLLKGQQRDLEMLLRLGAGVNAIESSSRLLVKVGPAASEVDRLSRMHCACTGLAYFGELVLTIKNGGYLDRLVELAAKGLEFSPIPVSLDEGRALLSPDRPGVGGNVLRKVRDRVTFHWDPGAFRDLLNQSQGQAIDLWTVSGDPPDRLFTASAYAVAQFTLDVPTDGQTADDVMRVFLSAVTVVGHVIEAAFIGLLVEAGETQPTKYFVKEA